MSKWQDWAIKLQALAQAGLYYTDSEFERERYREIRDIACEILQENSNKDIDNIKEFFCTEMGYQTPKLDTRAVCFKDDKLLLAQERSGKWAIPGGWTDVDQTVKQNVVKEAMEEAGAKVEPKFVICIHDWKSHIKKKDLILPFQIEKIFIYCKLLDQKFKPNSETLQADFFDINNLPELALGKNTLDQIKLCFKAHKNQENWKVEFD